VTPTDLPHDGIEELIAADVLHGLDELDRQRLERELERHGPSCAECDRLIAEYSEVAARIALSIDPASMSSGAEDRVVELARAIDAGPGGAKPPDEPARDTRRGPGRAGRWASLVAVAAVFALIGGVIGHALSPSGRGIEQKFLSFAAQPGARLIPFPSKGNQRLAVAVHSGQPGGWVVGAGLPGLTNDQVYELWYLPNTNGTLQPAGTFVPTDGRVVSEVTVGPSFVALAVSVEPHGGSKTPTLPPVFITNVTTSV